MTRPTLPETPEIATGTGPLVGVLVVTHGDAGAAMLQTLANLLGAASLEGMQSLGVTPGEDRTALSGRLDEAIRRLDTGAGVLILCDLQGATPANCCVDLKRAGRPIEIVCGVSLPMLLKLASGDRHSTVASLAKAAMDTALRSIRLGDGGAS